MTPAFALCEHLCAFGKHSLHLPPPRFASHRPRIPCSAEPRSRQHYSVVCAWRAGLLVAATFTGCQFAPPLRVPTVRSGTSYPAAPTVRPASRGLEQQRAPPPIIYAAALSQSCRVGAARATPGFQQDQLAILLRQAATDRRAVSQLGLLTAHDNVRSAGENLKVAIAAWAADAALLRKYVPRAPVAGLVVRNAAAIGCQAPQEIHATYTQADDPVGVMQPQSSGFQVKAYLDEILVPRLPPTSDITAQMFVRGGSNRGIALQFVRIDPYAGAKIERYDQRLERLDLRVLLIIFRLKPPPDTRLYPGDLADAHIDSMHCWHPGDRLR